ncbi:hypothetical protein E2C01_099749 [Portunus trituberculatus]|uniref:Uncharacterized protein n=1 Tax=Portunus trituberculatus TaxID=210409 RepID=A0A5B7KG61_PORTR|nr:hypothetical protein [Portunus trituberculatus]
MTPMKRKQLSLPQNGDIPVVIKKPRYSEEVVDDFTRASGVSKSNVLKHAEKDSVKDVSPKRKLESIHENCPFPVKQQRLNSESVDESVSVSCRMPQKPSHGKRKASVSAGSVTRSSKKRQKIYREESTSVSPLLSVSVPLSSSRSTKRQRTCREDITSPDAVSSVRATLPSSPLSKRQKTHTRRNSQSRS